MSCVSTRNLNRPRNRSIGGERKEPKAAAAAASKRRDARASMKQSSMGKAKWGPLDILHYNVGFRIAGGDAPSRPRSPRRPSTASDGPILRGMVMAVKHVLPIIRETEGGRDPGDRISSLAAWRLENIPK